MENYYRYTNKLINENSPYLLQHAHNPVDWYPWGNEAFKKAKNEDKLLLISIGYSACHWCHVMEKESFEDEEIAKIMNEHFVCIKVDREEHPDVDQLYMTAVQILTGNGGWPLNCFALPDGKPVYGGTYFRPDQWKQILKSLAKQYKSDKEKFIKSAERIQNGIQQSEFSFTEEISDDFDFDEICTAVENKKKAFDYKDGGFNRAPKFPLPSFWHFLLEYTYYTNDEDISKQLFLTLDKMASGGIYDQIGGGFARYSVDAYWKVPHFEKMLYDNAQLVSLYSYAYQLTKNELYKKTIEHTLEFIKREMTSPESAFYSSYDADSEGVEGKFYVWKKDEIDNIFGDDSNLFCDYYNVKTVGNWEHGNNILFIDSNNEKLLKKYNLTEDLLSKKLSELSLKLFKEREKRVKPGLDDKVLTSWNAMMMSAFIDAYTVFGNEDYLKQAEKSSKFLKKEMMQDNYSMYRSYKNGNSKINAFLDDYAFTIEAFIKLFQITGNETYLNDAKGLNDFVLKHFYDSETKMFFYSSDINFELIIRQKEISDNVIPASNSVIAKNLYKLGILFSDSQLLDLSDKMIKAVSTNAIQNIDYFGNWGSLMIFLSKPHFELVIIGKDHKKMKSEILTNYRPDVLYAGIKSESSIPIFNDRLIDGKTMIYVCKNNICKLPVNSVKDALKQLKTE